MKSFANFAFLISILFYFPAKALPSICSLKGSIDREARNWRDSSCEDKRDSPTCQDLYKKIESDSGPEVAKDKMLKCSDHAVVSILDKQINQPIGCLIGGYRSTVGSVVDLAGGLIDAEKRNQDRIRACDSNPEHKAKIFEMYNQSVPALLHVQMKPSTAANIDKVKCGLIEYELYGAIKQREKMVADKVDHKIMQTHPGNLTKEEEEYIAWKKNKINLAQNNSQGLWDLAIDRLKQSGVELGCYNTRESSAIACEALLMLAGGGYSVMTGLSGLKAARFVVAVETNAKRAEILARGSQLSNTERKMAAEMLFDRTLTSQQKTALIDAHKVPDNDILKKDRILRDGGFTDKSEREKIIRNGIAGDANALRLSAERTLAGGKFQESQGIFEGAADGFFAKKDVISARENWIKAGKPEKLVSSIKDQSDASQILADLQGEVASVSSRFSGKEKTARYWWDLKIFQEARLEIYNSKWNLQRPTDMAEKARAENSLKEAQDNLLRLKVITEP